MHNSLAAREGRGRFGRLWLTRTAVCGTQASCLAADGADRSHQRSRSTSAPCPDTAHRRLRRLPATLALGRRGAGWIAATFFVGHLTDHQRPALHLLAHLIELCLALLLRSLACALHRTIRRASPSRSKRVRDLSPLTAPPVGTDCPNQPGRLKASLSFLWPARSGDDGGDSLRRRGEPHGRWHRPHPNGSTEATRKRVLREARHERRACLRPAVGEIRFTR